jgi:hypothetical protein
MFTMFGRSVFGLWPSHATYAPPESIPSGCRALLLKDRDQERLKGTEPRHYLWKMTSLIGFTSQLDGP